MSCSSPARPPLPPGVAYRHSLGIVVVLALLGEFIFGAATYSNFLNRSSWMWLWGAGFAALPFLVMWRLLWLEKNGWWEYQPVPLPELPARFGGFDWKATFEADGVSASGGQLSVKTRKLLYSQIKRVEFGQKNGIVIVGPGVVPLTLGFIGDKDQMKIVTLLSHHAPQAEFRGALAAIRDGWQPRW